MNSPERFAEPLYVSKPALPPLADYVALLDEVWASSTLTNLGPLHQRLEVAVGERIGRGATSLWSSGTAALVGAIQALRFQGSVVVTPFTFPATVHALAALGIEPVFADVDPETLTLDPASVATRIRADTTGVAATHVYGALCDTDGLAAIASDANLRVLYDGAHSFSRPGALFPDRDSVLGDITIFSFHATKLFHTAEGGAATTEDPELDRRLRLARNFGITAEDRVEGVGLNGKMSELHAAMGLSVLSLLDVELEQRRVLAAVYLEGLTDLPGLSVVAGAGENLPYFVVRIDPTEFGSTRDELHATLRAMNVMSRRYFFPLCADLDPYRHLPSARDLPVARRAADEVLALPFHTGMSPVDAARVASFVRWHRSGGRP
ncbi:MAG: DegT/DnrJ/EryC1/StrS family aminotransferase [Pseudolysinimonas sp.]|uniref:DegT/DnrJ/EryC1/StrS family aminotransferase n=1 Tax=Pseudolysinimonas sp. TaxID=2680009 RepID=UPI003263F787